MSDLKNKIPKVLTIAGSDSSGGAGIQADLKTFHNLKVYGLSAITAVTAQNSRGVSGCWPVTSEAVYKQIISIHEDIEIDAVKIGMLSDLTIIKSVVDAIMEIQTRNTIKIPVVLDPVLISTSGYKLLRTDALDSFITGIIPLASVITPNIPEAEIITEIKINSMKNIKKAAEKIHKMGVSNVIIKGGHGKGTNSEDILYDGKDFTSFTSNRIKNKEVHGTGCVFSSAIAANLAKGKNITDSVSLTKKYITRVIKGAKPMGKEKAEAMNYIIS